MQEFENFFFLKYNMFNPGLRSSFMIPGTDVMVLDNSL